MRMLRGLSTIETLVMMLAMSLVMMSALAAKHVAQEHYRQQVHKDRALLYAMETMEQLESLRMTYRRQHFPSAWKRFLGDREGEYQLVQGEWLNAFQLLPVPEDRLVTDDDEERLRRYEEGVRGGIYTRLERRIVIEEIDDWTRRVTVSVTWAPRQQLRLQRFFHDDERRHLTFLTPVA